MKLVIILIISFILVGFVGSISGTYSYYLKSNELLQERVVQDLEFTTQTLENFIEEILEKQREKLEIIAIHQNISIEELKKVKNLQKEFSEIFVLDSTGKVIGSSDESQIGKDKSENIYFINARDKTYIKPAYFSSTTHKDSIAVSTPYYDGVLVARIELGVFNKVVTDRTGLGETGEALLAYRDMEGDVLFLTERRFEEDALDSYDEKYGINPIEEALNKNEKVVLGSFDYRRVEVLAVTRYIEVIDVALVVKVDKEEVFGVMKTQLVRISIINISIITFFVLIIGYPISYFILNPIKKLTSDVNEVTKGKLDIQLGRSGISEVQNLTDSLNRILASLKLAILRTGSSGRQLGLGDDTISSSKKVKTPVVKKSIPKKIKGGEKVVPLDSKK